MNITSLLKVVKKIYIDLNKLIWTLWKEDKSNSVFGATSQAYSWPMRLNSFSKFVVIPSNDYDTRENGLRINTELFNLIFVVVLT